MEKRLFTALFLSFAVLYAWSFFVVGPKKLEEQKLSQAAENKEVIFNSEAPKPILSRGEQPVALPLPAVLEVKTLEVQSDSILAKFSSKSGSITHLFEKEYNHAIPIEGIIGIGGYRDVHFSEIEKTDNSVAYRFNGEGYDVVKRYSLSDSGNLIEASVELTNTSGMSKEIALDIDGFQIDLDRLDNSDQRKMMLMEYSVSYNGSIERKKNVSKFKDKVDKVVQEQVNWIGFRDQYFCAIVKPVV